MSRFARVGALLIGAFLSACFEGPRPVLVDEAHDLAAPADLGAPVDMAMVDSAVPDLAMVDSAEPADLFTPDLTMVDLAHTPEVLIEDFCPMSLTGYVRCYVHVRPPDGY